MASIWERTLNLFDDRQERQASAATANQKSQALLETRDGLLERALEVKQNYQTDLAAATGYEARKSVHAKYEARFQGLNDAFAVLQQSEPGVTTKLDVDQFRRQAERHAEQQARLREYEQSLGRNNNEQARGVHQRDQGAGFFF